ncbi:MAG: hypothetical protein OHK0046_46180 [Anaerolineae bacterium]
MKGTTQNSSNSGSILPNMTFFPEPFEWVQVTQGDAVISNPFYNLSQVIHVSLADFHISKYPVTNDQYEYYLRDIGQQTKASTIQRTASFSAGKNPVIDIYYFEALAFCRWISNKISHFVTLPSDAQWIRAARGNTIQKYPWGNAWNGTECNTKESGIRHTTAVDQYPTGASPFNVMDMLGNVYEWCCTDPATGHNHVHDTPTDFNPFHSNKEAHRVFMGGSFDSSIRGASLDRYGGATTTSSPYVTGIRLVLNSSI